MVFRIEQATFLSNKMCINTKEFEDYLLKKFGQNAFFFDKAVEFLIQDPASRESPNINSECFWERFRIFLSSHGYSDDDAIFDYCYGIFNLFWSYYSNGLIGLFKERSSELDLPRIYLNHRISSEEQLIGLPNKNKIFRGMSLAEYESGSFGMSWSLDIAIASRFPSDKDKANMKSCVVQSEVDKSEVLYHDPNDSAEKEIIVKNGLLTTGKLEA